MVTLLNNFEGGTAGTTISTANSGGASGTAFDTVNVGTGATNAYDATHVAHGTLACKIATGGTAGVPEVGWQGALGAQPQVWFRASFYFTANPAAPTCITRLEQTGGSSCALVFLTAGGLLQIQNPAFSPLVATTSAIPLNQWFRVEGYVLAGAGTGQVALKLFDSNNSSVPTEFHTSAAAQTLGTNVNIALIGLSTSTASFGPFWMDDLGISTTGYLGPATAAAAPPSSPRSSRQESSDDQNRGAR